LKFSKKISFFFLCPLIHSTAFVIVATARGEDRRASNVDGGARRSRTNALDTRLIGGAQRTQIGRQGAFILDRGQQRQTRHEPDGKKKINLKNKKRTVV
jgi:hypothetical protein